MKSIVYANQAETTVLNEFVSRNMLAYGSDLMAVEVCFLQGGIGADHSHPHAQISYILSGTFEYHTSDGTRIVGKGDSLYFPCGAIHGVVCIEGGTILDIFTPQRSDFLS